MSSQGKSVVAFMLILVIALAVFSGCAKEEQNPAGTISDFDSQTHLQPGTSGDESGEKSGFVVSEKKYDYKSANLMLLNIENQTDKNYNVTIKGKYLNENGEIIKEEAQTFKAFPAGWSNNVIFFPKIAFDSFKYELETEEYVPEPLRSDHDGNPFASYVDLTYEKNLNWIRTISGGDENGHSIEARELLFYATLINSHSSITVGADFHVILLNEQGEIYLTDYDYLEGGNSGTATGPIGSEDDGKHRTMVPLIMQEVGQDETIPENVQGVFTAIFAITNVVDWEEQRRQVMNQLDW